MMEIQSRRLENTKIICLLIRPPYTTFKKLFSSVRVSYVLIILMSVIAFPQSALALPIASTEFRAKINATLLGGGPYTKAVPTGIIDLGNGIRFVAAPTAQVKAGAMSSAVANAPLVNDTQFDPPTGNPDTKEGRDLDLSVASNIADPVFLKTGYPDRLNLKSSENESVIADAARPDVVARTDAHEARVSDNRLVVRRDPKVKDGGVSVEPQNLGQFDITQRTVSKATANELEYSAAAAVSQGKLPAIRIQNRFNAILPVAGSGFDPRLKLDWEITDLLITAIPTVALGIISHTVELNLLGPSGVQKEVIGFEIHVKDGKVSGGLTGLTFDPAGDTTVADWVKNNLETSPIGIKIKPGAPNLTIDIPLDLGFRDTNAATLDILLESSNYQLTFEQPPVANGKGGVGAGANLDPSSGAHPNLHWDAPFQTLTFDPIPVNQLNDNFLPGIANRFMNDRLATATLEITPIKLLTSNNGQDFFSEGEVRFMDGVDLLFSAAFPTMFLDESLFEAQGTNLFAPLTDFWVDESIDSPWVDEYLAQGITAPGLVPELFIGLDGLLETVSGSSSFLDAQSFDAFGSVDIQGSVPPVPELPTLSLTLIGLLMIAHKRGSRDMLSINKIFEAQ